MEWLEESEKSLDSELEIANDPDKLKTQLSQHKVGLQLRKAYGALAEWLSWLERQSSTPKDCRFDS